MLLSPPLLFRESSGLVSPCSSLSATVAFGHSSAGVHFAFSQSSCSDLASFVFVPFQCRQIPRAAVQRGQSAQRHLRLATASDAGANGFIVARLPKLFRFRLCHRILIRDLRSFVGFCCAVCPRASVRYSAISSLPIFQPATRSVCFCRRYFRFSFWFEIFSSSHGEAIFQRFQSRIAQLA